MSVVGDRVLKNHVRMACTSLLIVGLTTLAAAQGQEGNVRNQSGATQSATPTPRDQVAPAAADTAKPSDAERISRLNRSIEADRKRLAAWQAELDMPDGQYQQAEEEFERLDAELDELKTNLAELDPQSDPQTIAKARARVHETARKRQLAEQRFELQIEQRKAFQDQIAKLEQKLAQDQAALDKLRGEPTASKPPEDTTAAAPAKVEAATLPSEPTASTTSNQAQLATPGTMLSITGTAMAEPAADTSTAANPAPQPDAEEVNERVDEELKAATEQARQKEQQASEAEDEARSIADRLAILQENVAVARTLRENSLRQVDNADDTVRTLENEYRRGVAEGLPAGQLEPLRASLAAAQQRFKAARANSRDLAVRLDELQTELAALQTDQIHALQEAEAKRTEAEAAQQHVDALQNPLAARNVLRWLLDHGPRILTILLAMCGFVWMSRMLENRLVDLMARRGIRGSVEDRENRAKTLVGVFRNAATMVIICGGVLMIFDEVGIPVGPLVGGAAVIGLAVAFGAQSLIKDFFTGFMILLEQQFMVNDVVRIGDISGQVERITLRMTMLRDLEGRVHFIPHGQINSTTNLTHGWSRAVFDVRVSYRENVDRVMNLLMEIGRELRRDPEFGPLILEDPVMLGVDEFRESFLIVKFYFKTRPLRQWPVKREMLRRMKNAFDEFGIEIPYPNQTLVHRTNESANSTDRDREPDWHKFVA